MKLPLCFRIILMTFERWFMNHAITQYFSFLFIRYGKDKRQANTKMKRLDITGKNHNILSNRKNIVISVKSETYI